MITEPMPFTEAIRFLLDKEQLPADWDAATWQDQEPDFRIKAFFSARVENARFLDRAQGYFFDFMAKVRETIIQPDGTVVTALVFVYMGPFVTLLALRRDEVPKVLTPTAPLSGVEAAPVG